MYNDFAPMWDFKLLKDLLYNFQQIKRRLKSEPLEILTNFLLLPLQIPNVVYGWSQVIKKGPLVQFPTKKMSKVGTIGFLMVWKLFVTGEIFYIRSGPPRLARPFFLVQSIGNFDQFFTPPPPNWQYWMAPSHKRPLVKFPTNKKNTKVETIGFLVFWKYVQRERAFI